MHPHPFEHHYIMPFKVRKALHVWVLSHSSCVWLFCDPVHCSLRGSSVYGIFQARMLEWVAVSSSSTKARNHFLFCTFQYSLRVLPFFCSYSLPSFLFSADILCLRGNLDNDKFNSIDFSNCSRSFSIWKIFRGSETELNIPIYWNQECWISLILYKPPPTQYLSPNYFISLINWQPTGPFICSEPFVNIEKKFYTVNIEKLFFIVNIEKNLNIQRFPTLCNWPDKYATYLHVF